MVVDVLSDWAMRDPEPGPHRRIHLHFLENPVEILGADGAVVGLRTERQELTGDGNVRGTGEFTDWDVQAVYRAVGYRSEAIEDLPFDTRRCVLPNDGGRVLDLDGEPLPGLYATGWVKRGPVGLIGHTKSDAAETVAQPARRRPGLAAGARSGTGPPSTRCWPTRACRSPTSPAGTGWTRTSWPPASRTAGPGSRYISRGGMTEIAARALTAARRPSAERCAGQRARRDAFTRVAAGSARRGATRRADRRRTRLPSRGSTIRSQAEGARAWCTRSRASSPAARTPRSS